MRRLCLPAALLVLGVGTALAAGPAGPTPTEACLVAAGSDGDREACIGETARACQAEVPAPDPLDIAICINGETEWWQTQLPAAYDAMAARAERLDSIHAATIAKGAPRLTDDLVALQESWTGWTEKRCTFEAMLMRGAPDRMVVAADCMLQQTARQALLLERGAKFYR